MSKEKVAAPAADDEAVGTVEAEETQVVELTGKDAIYHAVGVQVKELTGKRIGRTGGRKIFDNVVALIFAEATKEGTIRFNAGFGSMHVKTYGAGTRRLPSGQETTFGERQKLRYEEGVVVTALVANGGDLATVLAERRAAAEANAAPSDAPAAPAGGVADPVAVDTVDAGDDIDLD